MRRTLPIPLLIAIHSIRIQSDVGAPRAAPVLTSLSLRAQRSNLPYPRPWRERVRVRGNPDLKNEAGGSGGARLFAVGYLEASSRAWVISRLPTGRT